MRLPRNITVVRSRVRRACLTCPTHARTDAYNIYLNGEGKGQVAATLCAACLDLLAAELERARGKEE